MSSFSSMYSTVTIATLIPQELLRKVNNNWEAHCLFVLGIVVLESQNALTVLPYYVHDSHWTSTPFSMSE